MLEDNSYFLCDEPPALGQKNTLSTLIEGYKNREGTHGLQLGWARGAECTWFAACTELPSW